MPTQKQIEANRLNAQKSTGPRTEEGKRVSSQNALKSGLDAASQVVLGESPEDFLLLQTETYNRFHPTTPEQRFQVDNLIRNEWILRRLFRVEAQLWEYHAMQADPASGVPLGEAFSKSSTVFMRLHRRVVAADKAYKEAMAQLLRLQPQLEAPLEAPVQTEETTTESGELASFRTPVPTLPAPGPNPPQPAVPQPEPQSAAWNPQIAGTHCRQNP